MTTIGIPAKTLNISKTLIANVPSVYLLNSAQTIWSHLFWRSKLFNNNHSRLLTSEEIEVRVWAAVVLIVTLILGGIVGFMLYSVTFVAQPIKSMAPIDQAYTKMLNDIVLLIVGGIGGVMSRKGVQALSEKMAANQTPPITPTTAPVIQSAPQPVTSSMPSFNWMGITNPELDETWRPPPPPTTPPDYVDPAKEQIAQERAMARAEG